MASQPERGQEIIAATNLSPQIENISLVPLLGKTLRIQATFRAKKIFSRCSTYCYRVYFGLAFCI